MLESSIRDVVSVVERILSSERAALDRSLQTSGIDAKWGAILPYFSANLDVGMFPTIMIQQSSESFEWHSMPLIMEGTCELTIWGLVHFDQPLLTSEAIGRSAAVVARALNRAHLPVPLDSGLEVTFVDHAPLKSIQYGGSEINGVFVRSWMASFQSEIYAEVK